MISSKSAPTLALSLVLGLTLFLGLPLSSVAVAEEPALELAADAPSESPATNLCAAPTDLLAVREAPVLLAGSCTATADCWDGSHVTCEAQGTSENCSFTDSSCPTQRGYCWSSDEGFKYCPSCPCSAPSCDDIDGDPCGKPGTYSRTCRLGSNCNFRCICSTSGFYLCP